MEDIKVFQDSFGEDKNKCYFGFFDGYYGRFVVDMVVIELYYFLLNEMVKFDFRIKLIVVINILDIIDVEQVNL